MTLRQQKTRGCDDGMASVTKSQAEDTTAADEPLVPTPRASYDSTLPQDGGPPVTLTTRMTSRTTWFAYKCGLVKPRRRRNASALDSEPRGGPCVKGVKVAVRIAASL
ncbi:uncharacterized protein LOC125034819 isoform X4 [Penaeus chinensis]|uniref:uncharacterized protein LOC125034819 isoform X4 n=1 Tax=Penaeus chinensis TaxID=139456 RepID=UPI001FB7F2EC|nr:uncharacterized protein LOC125034819 isoform X4 [Penaeus chinensis]